MPRSTSDSFRDNDLVCATVSTPYGIPFFGWTGDEYRKLTMEELRPQYEAWERHLAALREQAFAHEVEEERVEEELFKDEIEGVVQDPNYLTVENCVPEIAYDTKPLTITEVDMSSSDWKGPSKFIVMVQDVEADSAVIHEKLDIGEAFVTEAVVSGDVALDVNDATSMPCYNNSSSVIGAHFLKRVFGNRNAAARTDDVRAAEELEEEREVEKWLFVGVQGDGAEVVAPKQRRSRKVKRTRRSLASVGNMMQ
ncbi:hypothetical protein C8T65DRAFT_744530 [Cerioporus squamosus]|nr:hypothetical protein C8T65DRAFT_744530 [Cerioporus squamosus]